MKKLTKACLMSAALLSGAGQAQAARENDAPVVTMTSTGNASGMIEVISTDGKAWNEIKSSALHIPTRIFIKNPSGYVVGYKILIMGPTAAHELLAPNKPSTFQKTMTLGSTDTGFNLAYKNEIIELCNDQLSRGKGLAETHNVNYDARVSLTAWLGWDGVENNDAVSRNMNVTVPVKCIKSENIAPLEIIVAVTQLGETCPKETRVTTVITYRYPAVSRFRYRMDSKLSQLRTITAIRSGSRPMPGFPGGGATYAVADEKTYHLDSGRHTFSVETRDGTKSSIETSIITCPPFKVTESWLKYKVQNTLVCPKNVKEIATFKATRPGSATFEIKTQDGLVVHSGTAIFKRKGREYVARVKRTVQMGAFESYMSARITNRPFDGSGSGTALLKVECLEYSGDFSFMDNTGTRCPREGKALVNFLMNIKKNIHYTLACSNGNFSGVAKAIPGNNGDFVAPALVKFNINQTTHANCRLSSVVAGQTKNHTLKGHVFKCIKRTTDPVTDDLSGGDNPTPTAPTTPDVIADPPAPPVNVVPGIIADPVRMVSCAGGIVRNRSCYCPRTQKKAKTGPNSWRCVRPVVSDPVRTNPTGGTPGTPGANTDTGPVGGAPGTETGADTNSAGGKPTRTNPGTTTSTRTNPGAEKRRLEELKKRQQAQKKAAAAARKKAAAARKKAAAAARKKVAAAARKKAAAAARKKAAAAAKRKAAAATAARRQSAATAAKRSNKKRKKKGRRTIAQ